MQNHNEGLFKNTTCDNVVLIVIRTGIDVLLHWLPVCFRINFKILLLVFKWIGAPLFIELLRVHTPAKALRSSNQMILDVPRSRLKNRGD